MNLDGTERFRREVKDSFYNSQFLFSQEDRKKYISILHEPGLTLSRIRPPYFSNEELEVWRKTGRPIGILFTEDGIELWKGWVNEKAPQTGALKKLMYTLEPVLPFDIHQHEHVTSIFTPTDLCEKDVILCRRLGHPVYDAHEKDSIPFDPSRRVGPYLKRDEDRSVGEYARGDMHGTPEGVFQDLRHWLNSFKGVCKKNLQLSVSMFQFNYSRRNLNPTDKFVELLRTMILTPSAI